MRAATSTSTSSRRAARTATSPGPRTSPRAKVSIRRPSATSAARFHAAPSVTIDSPANGQTVDLGTPLSASFALFASAGVQTCNATTANGASLDTSRAGTFAYTATVVDVLGQVATKTARYTVKAPATTNVPRAAGARAAHGRAARARLLGRREDRAARGRPGRQARALQGRHVAGERRAARADPPAGRRQARRASRGSGPTGCSRSPARCRRRASGRPSGRATSPSSAASARRA